MANSARRLNFGTGRTSLAGATVYSCPLSNFGSATGGRPGIRGPVVFVTFCVIVATLVGQGMTLPSLIRAVRLPADDGGAAREDAKARIKAAEAAMARLEELVDEGAVLPDSAERLRGAYGFRMNRFRARLDGDDDGEIEERSVRYQRARRELLDAERGAVVQLRNAGLINDEVMNRVQRDIDLEASRLDVSPG